MCAKFYIFCGFHLKQRARLAADASLVYFFFISRMLNLSLTSRAILDGGKHIHIGSTFTSKATQYNVKYIPL